MKKLFLISILSVSLFAECIQWSESVLNSINRIDAIVKKDASISYYIHEKHILRFVIDNAQVHCGDKKWLIDVEKFYFGGN